MVFPSDFSSGKIQNGSGRHFRVHFNHCNSVTVAHFVTSQEVLLSDFLSVRIQDEGHHQFVYQL